VNAGTVQRLVKIGAEAEGQGVDVMGINRPDDLGDIADPGLTAIAVSVRSGSRIPDRHVVSRV
jgi:hypothetical protein